MYYFHRNRNVFMQLVCNPLEKKTKVDQHHYHSSNAEKHHKSKGDLKSDFKTNKERTYFPLHMDWVFQ